METTLNNLILYALSMSCSDIHLVCSQNCKINLRIAGKMTPYRSLGKVEGEKMINYIRYIAKIDTNFKLKPQTGSFNLSLEGINYSFRVSSMPSRQKDSLVIRILDNHQTVRIDQLSLDETINEYFISLAKKNHGLVVLCGTTGSGKTTALYSILDYINQNYDKNIISIEDPIEIAKNYCLQIQLNPALDINYGNTLAQILRHDPDVIMIGEIRDGATANAVVQATLTGHLVCTTIHASRCTQGIVRLLNLGVTAFDLKETLQGVVCLKIVFNDADQLVLISEYIDRTNIVKYLTRREYQTYSFQKNIAKLVKTGALSQRQKEELLDEL